MTEDIIITSDRLDEWGKEDAGMHNRLSDIVANVTLPPRYDVLVRQDDYRGLPGRWYFQIECHRPDTYTGKMGVGHGGKAYLSPHATDSELVQTIFGLFKAYEEHEAREAFQYRDRRVFGPHIATQALWRVANNLDTRSSPAVTEMTGFLRDMAVGSIYTQPGSGELRLVVAPGITFKPEGQVVRKDSFPELWAVIEKSLANYPSTEETFTLPDMRERPRQQGQTGAVDPDTRRGPR